MAQKTEDPAVFTINGKCTDSTPEGPPRPQASPLGQLWTSSVPSHAGHWGLLGSPASRRQEGVGPCFSCAHATRAMKGTPGGYEAWGPHSVRDSASSRPLSSLLGVGRQQSHIWLAVASVRPCRWGSVGGRV